MVALVFFLGGCIGHTLNLGQKQNNNKAGFPFKLFVGWCVINTVSKSNIQIRKIERV